jgi:uncharacterized protein (DUF58 family)
MDTEFFKDLARLTLLIKKRVSSPYTGARRSLRFGRGISPVGYREYRKGDDFKLIDWKVYGRTEKLYVREHEEERSLVVQILLDASASMGYSDKFAYASKIAAGFAYLATLENEKYAISLFSEDLKPGEPRRSRTYLFHEIEDLDRTVPKGETYIKKAAEQFATLIKSTSLVVLISDLLERTEEVEECIYRLSGHDLLVVQVLSPNEADLDFSGDIKFVDLETKKATITRVTQGQKAEYSRRLQEHDSRIKAACKNSGADFFSFSTKKPIFEAFSELMSRQESRRG